MQYQSLKKKILNFFLILIFPIFFLFFQTFFLKNYYFHDTLALFEVFKHFSDSYQKFSLFTVWVDSHYGGNRIGSYFIFNPMEIASPLIILGKVFKIPAYYLFLIYLSLLYSIFFFGFYKLINELFLQKKILLLCFVVFLHCLGTNIYNEQIYTLLVYILFPYYIYYFCKFNKNNKIQELYKILYLSLTKFALVFHYSYFIEVYILIFIFLYFYIKKRRVLNIVKQVLSKYNFKRFIPVILLFLVSCLNYISFQSYTLTSHYRNLAGKISFENFIGGGGGNLVLMKFHTWFSNFFWGESTLIIGSVGLFFLIVSLSKKENFANKIFFISFIISITLLILCFIPNYPLMFKNLIGKILYYLPLMKYQFHLFYLHLFAKPFLFILILFGLNEFMNNITKKNYLINRNLLLFIAINSLYILLIDKPSFYKNEIIISQLLSITGFFIFIIFLYLNKRNFYFLFFLIFLSLISSSIYNFSLHSFSNKISPFKKDIPKFAKFRDLTIEEYEKKYFNNKYDLNFNYNCLSNKQIYSLIPSTKIKEFLPRGSTDYAENLYNQGIYGCENLFNNSNPTIVENIKKFKDKPINFISNSDINIKVLNSQSYSIKINENIDTLNTNISYSKYWEIKNKNNQTFKTYNFNNLLSFDTKGYKEFFIEYKNINENFFLYIKLIFGGFVLICFFLSLLRNINLIK